MKTYSKVGIILAMLVLLIFAMNTIAFSADLSKENKKLLQELKSEKYDVRVKAAQKLGENKCCDAIKPLVKILKNDAKYNARIVAAHSLYKIGDKKVLQILKERAKLDDNKTVRTVLEGIIKKMEG